MIIKFLSILTAVCITSFSNIYADLKEQTSSVIQANEQQVFDINNQSNNESLENFNDLNQSFYIPQLIDVLGQPIIQNNFNVSNQQYPHDMRQELRDEFEYNTSQILRIDWRLGHTYRQSVTEFMNTYYLKNEI